MCVWVGGWEREEEEEEEDEDVPIIAPPMSLAMSHLLTVRGSGPGGGKEGGLWVDGERERGERVEQWVGGWVGE